LSASPWGATFLVIPIFLPPIRFEAISCLGFGPLKDNPCICFSIGALDSANAEIVELLLKFSTAETRETSFVTFSLETLPDANVDCLNAILGIPENEIPASAAIFLAAAGPPIACILDTKLDNIGSSTASPPLTNFCM